MDESLSGMSKYVDKSIQDEQRQLSISGIFYMDNPYGREWS